MEVQFRGLKTNEVGPFADPRTEVILWPPEFKSDSVIYPYTVRAPLICDWLRAM